MPEEQKDLIDEMLKDYEGKSSKQEEQVTGSEEVGEEKETEQEEAPDTTQHEEQEAPEQKEEEKEEEKEEAEGEEESEEKSEIEALRETIERMSSEKPQLGDDKEDKDEKEEEGKEEGSTKEKAKEAFDLSDDEYDEIISNKSKFVEFLNKFGSSIRERTREDYLREIPNVVQKTTSRQQALMRKKDEFYKTNPDLEKHMNYVGYKANQLYAANPKLSLDELFAETATAVRKDLALNEQAVSQEEERIEKQKKQKKKPAFAGSTRGSRSTPGDERGELQKELDAMIQSTR